MSGNMDLVIAEIDDSIMDEVGDTIFGQVVDDRFIPDTVEKLDHVLRMRTDKVQKITDLERACDRRLAIIKDQFSKVISNLELEIEDIDEQIAEGLKLADVNSMTTAAGKAMFRVTKEIGR